jgi:hypothetical protein
VAQQPQGRFRRFLTTPVGRILLVLLAVLVVFASYAYVSFIIAIPAILLFGLAVPIWAGLKRPRYLALAGLAIILTVAPLASVVVTQEIRTPESPASSSSDLLFSNGSPVMQNAGVSPYTGSTSTNFTWSVTVYPGNHPANNSTPVRIDLYISTCPGATGNSSPACTAGYPFTDLENNTLPNTTTPYTVRFHYDIGSNGIWAWQMGIYTNNTTTKKAFFQLLVGDPTYNGIEGPVVGSFSDTYFELLPEVYFEDFLFLGVPFYVILLVYMLFKNRERRRKEAERRALGPVPPAGKEAETQTGGKAAPLPSSSPGGPPGSGAAPTSAVTELNCPKCNAVVYAGEKSCWKCGATLPGGPSSGSAGSA